MKIKNIVAVLAGTALLSSCEYQKYNHAEQLDVRKGSEWVYGVHPDSAARQLAITYPENSALELRTADIRKKLYGDNAVYKK